MNRCIPISEQIKKSKEQYQKKLLESSYMNKIRALVRLQEKVSFFQEYHKFSESFSMSNIIDILDDLQKNDLIDEYVLGGATALLYYSTPHLTEDIDVFISVQHKGIIINLSPIYSFLKKKYKAKEYKETLLLDDNPVQFLVPMDGLTEEAFKKYNEIKIRSKKLKIFSLEYLIAIMLHLGKSKYKERLRVVKEENKYDSVVLNKILKKYNLESKWIGIGE
jgi:hypothetical protein